MARLRTACLRSYSAGLPKAGRSSTTTLQPQSEHRTPQPAPINDARRAGIEANRGGEQPALRPDLTVCSACPHPSLPLVRFGPCKKAARKFLDGSNPATGVFVLHQPRSDLIHGALVMNFSDDEGSLTREKAFPSAQHFVLAPFHVNLN